MQLSVAFSKRSSSPDRRSYLVQETGSGTLAHFHTKSEDRIKHCIILYSFSVSVTEKRKNSCRDC
jgi:hypothetical protein